MPTPFESATLNLRLFEMRREPLLREARAWFVLEFTPLTFDELAAMAGGERNRDFRMVLSYWEMACSLVTAGAIDAQAFAAAHNELVATFAKVYPFLAELRDRFGEPDFCTHLEQVVLGMPDAEAAMIRRRAKIWEAWNTRAAVKVVC